MNIFKKISEKFDSLLAPSPDEIESMQEFGAHLQQIGVNATVVDWKSPEAKEYRSLSPTGYVKVEGRTIDLITVSHAHGEPGEKSLYFYHYWTRVNVEVLETKEVKDRYGALKVLAWFMPIKKRKGLFSQDVVGYRWEGGELAQLLSADSELKNTIDE